MRDQARLLQISEWLRKGMGLKRQPPLDFNTGMLNDLFLDETLGEIPE